MIAVVRVGLLATVQDLGRNGWAHLGVPRSGALDTTSLVRANRLVGNPDSAAAIESTLRGLTLDVDETTTFAATGAACSVTVDGHAAKFDRAVVAPAGARIVIGKAVQGMRTYVAVAGAIDVPPVLGSRSADSLSGLGPKPLVAGDRMPVGAPAGGEEPMPGTEISDEITVRIWFGPRDDWFTHGATHLLTRSAYQLTQLSNRVGARLAGPALTRANAAELPSEPLVLGAVQVLPDGQPLVFLADHPTTGGYPVIGVVDAADIPRLGQMKPGGTVRFMAGS